MSSRATLVTTSSTPGRDQLEKREEVLGRVALRAAMGDLAGCDVERSVEIEDAVALVVVRVATWLARAQRKRQLSAFQSLNLRLFVDADHDRVLRWVQVEPHDISVHEHHVHRHPHPRERKRAAREHSNRCSGRRHLLRDPEHRSGGVPER